MATGGSPAVWQCQACQRQFGLLAEGMGELRLLERPRLVVPETMLNGEPFFCGEPDCAAAAQAFAARVAAQQKAELMGWKSNRKSSLAKRERRAGKQFCRAAVVDPEAVRSSCPPERDIELAVTPSHHPAALEAAFQAEGGAESANAILLKFFREPKNFMQAFRSTDLEEMTRAAGHGSSRMNNRAIWLREQFTPSGLYLDNDPSGAVWDLPKGSYYRLCRIEDATSLTDEQKRKLLNADLRQDAGSAASNVK